MLSRHYQATPPAIRAEAVAELRAFIEWTQQQGIELRVFVSPRRDGMEVGLDHVIQGIEHQYALPVARLAATSSEFYDATHFDEQYGQKLLRSLEPTRSPMRTLGD